MPSVQIIKATKNHTAILENKTRKLKVAAYARVSTEKDEQENSYETQIMYFTDLIRSNPNYIFVDMYADEGLTGTMLKNRDSFNQMISDALEGKIDIIYVKSVSRFARNTVDSLCICRELKNKGVNVIFEKENLELLSASGELMLTIFASLAQEESRSISENVKWTIHKNYEKGIYHMPYSSFLGYKKGDNGKMVIDEEQAVIVRKIYKMFLYGYSINSIAKELTETGVLTPRGKNEWSQSTIRSILTNEKYCGDARLQKKFTANFLDHKAVKNEGQVASYYVTDDHEGIVSHEVYETVQEMIKNSTEKKNCGDMYSRKLYCECGKLYGRKVHHSNDKYRTTIYRCNDEYSRDHIKCARLKEKQIQETYIQAVNELIQTDNIVSDIFEIAQLFKPTETIDDEISVLIDKRNIIEHEIQNLVEESSKATDIDKYRSRYDNLVKEYENASLKVAKVIEEKDKRKAKYQNILRYANHLKELTEPIKQFDDELWFSLLDKATVKEKSIIYQFKDGREVEIEL